MRFQRFKVYCEIIVSPSVVHRALKVALIVGTTLNIINQTEVLIHFDLGQINFLKFFLTYLVPYGVTTYTATAMQSQFRIGTRAEVDAYLVCDVCHNKLHIQKGDVIPGCGQCGVDAHWKLA